jgi:hypothetical protein
MAIRQGQVARSAFLVTESNESQYRVVSNRMKAMLPPALFSLSLATLSPAQTCREVVRDSSGRIVQTIERQIQGGGNERAVIRDASGRVTGTATTRPIGRTTTTLYRDASGRLSGSASTNHARNGRAHTVCRNASGRMAATADTTKLVGAGSKTQFRDASGRLTGSEITSKSAGTTTGTQRDASGRLTGSSTGGGKYQGVTRLQGPPGVKK